MQRVYQHIAVFLAAIVLTASSGCAFFTAQRVATMAGKEVGKRIVKKGIEKVKEDQEQRDRANENREIAQSERD
jgi:hypothetical protein